MNKHIHSISIHLFSLCVNVCGVYMYWGVCVWGVWDIWGGNGCGVCVCMGVCMWGGYGYMCVCVGVGAGEQKLISDLPLLLSTFWFFFWEESFIGSTAHQFSKICWLVSSRDPILQPLPPQCRNYRHTLPYPAFYIGPGDWNYIYMASTVLTEPFPQPLI